MIPIPVTLLTGFLGSGKTTLLNALLRHPAMERAAIVVNEFGEIGLDHDLIEAARDNVTLLPSGCLCCTLRGDLATTLARLRERRAEGQIAFDRIVIETTGIADPAPLVQMLALDPELTHDFTLDGLIATADAASGGRIFDEQFEARQQIAMADRIVVTKSDLIAAPQLGAFETKLRGLNPHAQRFVAPHGQIEPAVLFGIAPGAHSKRDAALEWVAALIPAKSGLPQLSDLPAPKHAPLHQSTGHTQAGRVSSQSIELDTPVEPMAFQRWMDQLARDENADVLRLKAVVHVQGMAHPFALHAVQRIFHPPVSLPNWPAGDTTSRIVLIGRDLPDGFIDQQTAILTGTRD